MDDATYTYLYRSKRVVVTQGELKAHVLSNAHVTAAALTMVEASKKAEDAKKAHKEAFEHALAQFLDAQDLDARTPRPLTLHGPETPHPRLEDFLDTKVPR